jgi:hypothetical protein
MAVDEQGAKKSTPLPLGLILVILSCWVRAGWALWNVFRFSRYVLSHRVAVSGLGFVLFGAIIWAVLGIGLWRRANSFRLAAMAWSGVAIGLSGYGLLSTLMQRSAHHSTLWLVFLLLAVDFAVIAYLAQAKVEELFKRTAQDAKIAG